MSRPVASRLGSWRVLEEGPGEHDGVGKDDDPTRRLQRLAGQLVELDPHEADLRHLAVHVPERPLETHAIADADPVRRDHREVAGDREDHVLEREGDARRREAERGHQGGHLAGEVEDQHEARRPP